MASNQAVAVFQAVALKAETTYGTAADPAGTDFYHVSDGTEINASRVNAAIPDKTGTSRSRAGAIPGFPQSDGTFNLVVRASGSAGTVPNIDGLLQNTFFGDSVDNTSDAVQAAPSPTTTSYKIATPANVTAGTFVVVTSNEFTPVGTAEARFCTNNSTGTLTVTPAHSAPPVTADVVSATNTYSLKAARDGSLTMWSYIDSGDKVAMISQAMPGFAPTTMAISWEHGGEGYLNVSFSGEGSGEEIFTGRTTLSSAITGSLATDVTVSLTELGVVSVGSRILIEAEAMKVTAKSADTGTGTMTVERGYDGTTRDTHAISTAVRPYRPTPSLSTQTPIPSIYCDVFIGGTSVQFPATRVSVNLNDNISVLRDSSSSEGQGTDYAAGMRTVEVEIEGYLRDSSQLDAFRGFMGLGSTCFIQWGRTAGKLVMLSMPNVVFQGTPISGSGDGPVSVVLRGEARLSSSDEDELKLGFG